MHLARFTVSEYRSISNASVTLATGTTTLIGRNNEGKSNLLRALMLGLDVGIGRPRWQRPAPGRVLRIGRTIRSIRTSYDWDLDFPVGNQASDPEGVSSIQLEFSLSALERRELKKLSGETADVLAVRVILGSDRHSEVRYTVGTKAHELSSSSSPARAIRHWLSERFSHLYIPAVRTGDVAEAIVDQILAEELEPLLQTREHQRLVEKMEALQAPVLSQIEETLRDTLSRFLPGLAGISLLSSEHTRAYGAPRAGGIVLDDGEATPLSTKGDGIQSIVALALMRLAARRSARDHSFMVAIEEPESHLHPEAIRELARVIAGMGDDQQVLVSTHSPLLLNRQHGSSTVIVENNTAELTNDVARVRECLGVRASDNLRHADLVLLVEGDDDVRFVRRMLTDVSDSLASALDSGSLAITAVDGASKLSLAVSYYRDALCMVHAFVDDDVAGRQSLERLLAEGTLGMAHINLCKRRGMPKSETEDLLRQSFLVDSVLAPHFGIHSTTVDPGSRQKKFSARMCVLFGMHGKPWDDVVEMELKRRVSNAAAAEGVTALTAEGKRVMKVLAKALEAKCESI